ncbi:methyltransferase family protein [Fretibacterium sp. OH1220_COT-178]|uniref:methyltransferase family protein n=1 Tax=Fretibacterium sp. OH1220_COT-178 TaxID=2491047 RepID=UPI000F5E7976|nr:isoprenylcysteine carboxylmethyltransferase family protein [Fretibacterium sp. OH1220_COT-178]RRD65238.1 isoprenylcysteine carboxylmethyltransferase family protein [Fretibacterium sp. OH1220_COT-178]
MQELRRKVFKLRGGIWTLLFVLILLLARPTVRSFLLGLPFVLLGQSWRFWAVGCIGRYRGEAVGAERLATWGPYAFMRNPLYFGNGLIGLGWGLMSGPWATVLFLGSFIVVYGLLIVPHEESFLLERFGDEYRAYRRRTGAFLPKGWPGGRIAGPFAAGVLWTSERHTLLSTVVGTLLIAAKGFLS